MGLFDCEKTVLEMYIKNNLQEQYNEKRNEYDKGLLDYAIDVSKGKIRNPFQNEEFFIKVLEILANTSFSKEYNQARKDIDYAVQNYETLISIYQEKVPNELLEQIFFQSIHLTQKKEYRFNEQIFALFENKLYYVEIMNIIQQLNLTEEQIKYIFCYMLEIRQYYLLDEVSFKADVLNFINKDIRHGQLVNIEEVIAQRVLHNQKRAGIYPIDENTLSKINVAVNGANGTLGKLDRASKKAEQQVEQIHNSIDEINQFLQQKVEETIAMLSEATTSAVSKFQQSYLEHLQKEKNQLTLEKDACVRHLIEAYEKLVKQLENISISISGNTTNELKRVRLEANAILEKIKDYVTEDSDLKKIVYEFENSQEILKTLSELEELKTLITEPKRGTMNSLKRGPELIIPSDNNPINHYFDKSISFPSRMNELLEKKAKRVEEGELFHEQFDRFLTMIIEDWNPYLYGPSGCGKSFLLKQASSLLDLGYLNIGKINESYDIVGHPLIDGQYNYPEFFLAYVNGLIAFCDELDTGFADATTILNNFTSNDNYCFPGFGRANRHPNFRLVAAGNTTGYGANKTFSGRHKIEESLQQRLTPLFINYDIRVEEQILNGYPEWIEFIKIFRKATDAWQAKNGDLAPGIFTTRDAAKVKEALNHDSFDLVSLIQLQFIENKGLDYLKFLASKVESCTPEVASKQCDEFVKQIKKLRNDGYRC